MKDSTPETLQIAKAFSAYFEATSIACGLLQATQKALQKGRAHSRSELELALHKYSKRLDQLQFDTPPSIKTNTRLFDLVRYMRSELHEANLITDEEYTWLLSEAPEVQGSGSLSARRLEDYDELIEKLSALQKQ